jgi:uncharacterized phage-associated protein
VYEGEHLLPKSIDVAEYILKRCGPQFPLKLQSLVYYSQAWSLVWDGRSLFDDEIQAWPAGPVAPLLHERYPERWPIETVGGNAAAISDDPTAVETIESVINFYAPRSRQWLYDLTHMERPWKEARGELRPGAPCERPITHHSMTKYYAEL